MAFTKLYVGEKGPQGVEPTLFVWGADVAPADPSPGATVNRALLPLFALTISTSALARPPHPHDPDAVLEHAQDALEHVGATPEQQTTVRSILDEALPQLSAYRDEAHDLHHELHALFEAERVDRVAVEEIRIGLVDLFDRATATAFGHLVDLSETFTVEQRAQLRAQREQRRARWRSLVDGAR